MKYLLEIIFAEFSGQCLKYTHNTCYLLKNNNNNNNNNNKF